MLCLVGKKDAVAKSPLDLPGVCDGSAKLVLLASLTAKQSDADIVFTTWIGGRCRLMLPSFETERLLLRPRTMADFEACLAMNEDPEVMRFIPGPWDDPELH